MLAVALSGCFVACTAALAAATLKTVRLALAARFGDADPIDKAGRAYVRAQLPDVLAADQARRAKAQAPQLFSDSDSDADAGADVAAAAALLRSGSSSSSSASSSGSADESSSSSSSGAESDFQGDSESDSAAEGDLNPAAKGDEAVFFSPPLDGPPDAPSVMGYVHQIMSDFYNIVKRIKRLDRTEGDFLKEMEENEAVRFHVHRIIDECEQNQVRCREFKQPFLKHKNAKVSEAAKALQKGKA